MKYIQYIYIYIIQICQMCSVFKNPCICIYLHVECSALILVKDQCCYVYLQHWNRLHKSLCCIQSVVALVTGVCDILTLLFCVYTQNDCMVIYIYMFNLCCICIVCFYLQLEFSQVNDVCHQTNSLVDYSCKLKTVID